ncbi:dnaJ homolog subfamily A member 4 [Telopea speciosissima]|uniref:dnaJ homolog subfamily A member 4 n=1 Tax=Telopea speciosissima TaxID=54955 RepID=UPI001CC61D90|nr:dnaJ homolog subfamily A member 4 [Telopea speciosissima]
MERMGEEDLDFKSQLVIEICSFSSRSTACKHRGFQNPIKSPLIDWYLLLRVEEDADIEIIRKQYRKFALQLHPDKNKHPKAEVAFKLVSQAYACLSDRTKRRAFDSERWKSFCTFCSQRSSSKFPGNSEDKLRSSDTRHRTRSNKISQSIREVRDRFNEETKVIERCLRATHASRNEFPVFDPSKYSFQDYPHYRTRIYNKPNDFWLFR